MSSENFLKRLSLLNDMDKIMREAIYHRNHDEDEKLDGMRIWHWDEPEGESEATV